MIKREKLKPSKLWDDNMRPIFQCTFFILVINIITNLAIRLQRLAVTPLEKYLYYGNLAIGEECFFRVLLGITIMIGLAWLIKKGGTRSPWPAYIITSIITAASWSITHWYVYKQTPLMFVGLFAMGIVLQLYLFTTRNPLVPIVAHFINNLIASVFVFIGVSAIWVFL
jgi:membrane protease YdiL (CAAX protease family)